MRKWDAGEEAGKEPGEGNEVIAVVELSEMTEGHRRSTDNHHINPKRRNFEFHTPIPIIHADPVRGLTR